MANVPTNLTNLETKIYELDVDKLKTVPIYFKKSSDVVNKKLVKTLKFNKLNTKK